MKCFFILHLLIHILDVLVVCVLSLPHLLTDTNLHLGPENVCFWAIHGIKGYKVLDLATNLVYISRDIVFYESIFPYASTSSPSTSYLTNFVFPHVNSNSSCTSDCPSFTTPTHSFLDSTPIPNSDLVVSHSDFVALEPTPHTSHTSLPDSNSLEPTTHASIPDLVHVPNLDLDITPITQTVQPPLRRSTRPHVPPSYLSKYSCKTVVSAKP